MRLLLRNRSGSVGVGAGYSDCPEGYVDHGDGQGCVPQCPDGQSWSVAYQECALITSGNLPGGGGGYVPPTGGGAPRPKTPAPNPLLPLVLAAAVLGTIALVLAETAPRPVRRSR